MIISLKAMQSLSDAQKAKLANSSKNYVEVFKNQLRQRIIEDTAPSQVSLATYIFQENSKILKQIREDLKTDPDALQKETEKLLAEVQRLNIEQNKRTNEEGYSRVAIETTIDRNYLSEMGLLTKSQKKNLKKKNNKKKYNGETNQFIQELHSIQEESKQESIEQQKSPQIDKVIVSDLLDLLGGNGRFGKHWNYDFLSVMSKYGIIDYYFLPLKFDYKVEGKVGLFERIRLPIVRNYNKELVDRYVPNFFKDIVGLIKRLSICKLINGNATAFSSFFYFRLKKIVLEVATTIKELDKKITEIERKQLDEINYMLLYRLVTEMEWQSGEKNLKGTVNDLLQKGLIDKNLIEKVDRLELGAESTSFPTLKESLYRRINLLDIDDIYYSLEWSEEKDTRHLKELMNQII